MRFWRAAAGAALVVSVAACQGLQPPPEGGRSTASPPPAYTEFEPGSYVAPIQHVEGRYGNLFTPDSFAVWVGPKVAALKEADAQRRGEAISDILARQVTDVSANYLVVECHLSSQFEDMSFAYDSVGFRGFDVYLELPDGQRVWPVQTLIGSPVHEEQVGTLRRFSRVNVLVFPRRTLGGTPVVDASTGAVYLNLAGAAGSYRFEWAALPPGELAEWTPNHDEFQRMVRLTFSELYEELRRLGQRFH